MDGINLPIHARVVTLARFKDNCPTALLPNRKIRQRISTSTKNPQPLTNKFYCD